MRKSERLFDAITGIRDDLIEKAADGVPKRFRGEPISDMARLRPASCSYAGWAAWACAAAAPATACL